MNSESDFEDLIHTVLSEATPALVSQLLSRLRPYNMSRAQAEKCLKSPSTALRVEGLTFVLTDLGYGADPEFAARLGGFLLRVWNQQVEKIPFQSAHQKSLLLLTIVRSTAQACVLMGRFEACVQIIDEWLLPDRFRTFGELYVSTYLRKAEAFAHQLKISEAAEELRRLSPEEIMSVREAAIVWGYIAPYLVDNLKPDTIFNYREKIQEIIDGPLAENKKVVALWAKTWQLDTLPQEHQAWANSQLEFLRAELERLTNISADSGLTDADRVDHLFRGLNAFSVKARDLLLAGAEPSVLDLHGADALTNYAAMIHGLTAPTSQEIEGGLDSADKAATWYRQTGCRRGLLDALQAKRALNLVGNRKIQAKEASLELYEQLRSLRKESRTFEVRAAISRVYRGLVMNICQAAADFSEPAAALSATEFRRGLSIAEPRRPVGWHEPEPLIGPLRAELIGPKTHYLSLTAFDEEDPIAAALYCADGTISFQWISLTPAQFRRAAERLNPRKWTDRSPIFGKPRTDPRRLFASLLDPVEKALDDGRVGQGDHICVAVDDPMQAVPLHYLPLRGQLAIDFVSFSIVASFADACLIFESSVKRPRKALAAFVPAMPERNVDLKKQAFFNVCETLKVANLQVDSIQDAAVDRDGLLNALGRYSLIHIHSHGFFREDLDPVDHAGILVSKDGRLPPRGLEVPWLLTPGHLLGSDKSAAGSFIALSACVSGLGRRGLGGDRIGLEFALRVKGASSIVASHWDVTWRSASSFFESFYSRWLIQGETRAQAWRHAILDQANLTRNGDEGLKHSGCVRL